MSGQFDLMNISSSEEDFDSNPKTDPTSFPTSGQLKIKTEASGMTSAEIEAALKSHTLEVIARSKTRLNREDLNKSGLSLTEITRREREQAAKLNMVEEIDFEELAGIEDDCFDFSKLATKDWEPKYVSATPTSIPQDIIDMHKPVKSEKMEGHQIDEARSQQVLDNNPLPSKINRWWIKLDESSVGQAVDPKQTNDQGDKQTTVQHDEQGDKQTPEQAADKGDKQPPKQAVDQGGNQPPEQPVERHTVQAKKNFTSKSLISCNELDSSEEDMDPKQATKTFLHFYMKEDRRSALVLELAALHPEGAIIFKDSKEEEEKQKATKDLIARIKARLDNSHSLKEYDHMTDLLQMLSENPRSFLKVNNLVNELLAKGVSDPDEICGRITFDDEVKEPRLLPQHLYTKENNTLDPRQASMISSYDSRLSSRYSCPGTPDTSNTEGSCNARSAGFLTPVFTSTPYGSQSKDDQLVPEPPGKRARMLNFSGVDTTQLADTPAQYLIRHKIAAEKLAKISCFPIQGRITVGQWKIKLRQGLLKKPLPIDYHPRYSNNPLFLTHSFNGEAMPGLFRPCSSKFTEAEAWEAYKEDKGSDPQTLADLNSWTRQKYPPSELVFDPSKHCIECQGYEMQFWTEISQLELSRTGAGTNTPTAIPHCPRDHVTAHQFWKLHSEFIEPLAPYVAEPLLTTLGPSFASRRRFFWWSITMPKLGGDLVIKDVLFDHNSMSYIVNNSSKVGRCAVCTGLLLLPDHVTYLAYFRPANMDPTSITPNIVQAWQAQKIAVCFAHALTDAVLKPGRNLKEKMF